MVIVPLIRKLYDLKATIYCYRNSIYATVWSKSLVLFKSEEVGLPIGVKDDLKYLPSRIIEKGESSNSCPSVRTIRCGRLGESSKDELRLLS